MFRRQQKSFGFSVLRFFSDFLESFRNISKHFNRFVCVCIFVALFFGKTEDLSNGFLVLKNEFNTFVKFNNRQTIVKVRVKKTTTIEITRSPVWCVRHVFVCVWYILSKVSWYETYLCTPVPYESSKGLNWFYDIFFFFFVHLYFSQSSLDSLAKSQETSEGMSLVGRSQSKHSEDAVDSTPVSPIPVLPMTRHSHFYEGERLSGRVITSHSM